jgi:ribosomal protein S27AE
MTEWKLKSCPRCGGDIYLEEDNDDCYARCLQCGYAKLLPALPAGHYSPSADENYLQETVRRAVTGGVS